jgi:Domain of unknown function (DUF5069)
MRGMNVPGLRSPYEKVGGIFYFGRMLDKIRLHAAGKLPEDFQANLGKGFDGRITRFLHVDYNALVERVKQGGSDEEILQWCFENGRKWTNDEELEVWNTFMRKVGWNDDVTPTLQRRLREGGFEGRADVQTIFDYIDLDEGRDPRQRSAG